MAIMSFGGMWMGAETGREIDEEILEVLNLFRGAGTENVLDEFFLTWLAE